MVQQPRTAICLFTHLHPQEGRSRHAATLIHLGARSGVQKISERLNIFGQLLQILVSGTGTNEMTINQGPRHIAATATDPRQLQPQILQAKHLLQKPRMGAQHRQRHGRQLLLFREQPLGEALPGKRLIRICDARQKRRSLVVNERQNLGHAREGTDALANGRQILPIGGVLFAAEHQRLDGQLGKVRRVMSKRPQIGHNLRQNAVLLDLQKLLEKLSDRARLQAQNSGAKLRVLKLKTHLL